MTPDPDVTPVGFAATDAPGAALRRRRNPLWLLLALLCLAAGLGGPAWFVAEQVGTPGEDEAIARGRIAALDAPETPVVRFAHDGGELTVWLDHDGVSTNSTVREQIVAATNCQAQVPGGRIERFRGAVQGSSVTIGSRSTVGVFSAPAGTVAVACRQEPFGRLRLRDRLREEHAFFVTPGAPSVGWAAWVAMFAGLPLLFAAFWAGSHWRAGRVGRR